MNFCLVLTLGTIALTNSEISLSVEFILLISKKLPQMQLDLPLYRKLLRGLVFVVVLVVNGVEYTDQEWADLLAVERFWLEVG